MRCLNPETHHGIIVNGETFKKLIKKGYRYNNVENYLYKDEETVYRYVTNPETMKRISTESPTFLILLECISIDNNTVMSFWVQTTHSIYLYQSK